MVLKMFSVFDSKVKAYMTPFFVRTAGEAERSFADAVNREDSNFKRHAEDFTLFELGAWDDSSGNFELLDTPHALVKAVMLLEKDGV